ncbi:MAG TPA: hypothetical protein PK798_07605 [Flavobacteriales bacterium]|nr:hypothetical protein [Flavobacteriales bacterium]HRJ38639.1 hypothetical protein [Flavobacteriales bacterium]
MKKFIFKFIVLFTLITASNALASSGIDFDLNENWTIRSLKSKTTFPISKENAPSAISALPQIIEHYYSVERHQLPKHWSASDYARLVYLSFIKYGIELKCEFQIPLGSYPRTRIELVLTNANTFCTVLLNGKKIGKTDNAFRVYKFDVRKNLKDGNNILLLRFKDPVNYAEKKLVKKSITLPADNQTNSIKSAPYIRQPQQEFGWDFARALPYVGLRSFPIIEFSADIHSIEYWFDSVTSNGNLTHFNLNLSIISPKSCSLVPEFNPEMFESVNGQRVHLSKGKNTLTFKGKIRYPKLWWPAGSEEREQERKPFGINEPNLIPLSLNDTLGNVVFQEVIKFYVAKIQLDRSRDSIGEKFAFIVNGKEVFIRGINMVLPDATGDYNIPWNKNYREPISNQLLHQIQSANINMIRVWGGGSYLPDAFYDWADENGIMIWQDFMFSGTLYPGEKSFLQSISAEADDQIKRLRNHPCIALWCGNNEIDVALKNWGWQTKYNYSSKQLDELSFSYNKIFREILPGKISVLDPQHFYIESSPLSNWGKPEDLRNGNNHLWSVWHGEAPIESYKKSIPRFATEYGLPSLPSEAVLKDLIINNSTLKEQLSNFMISYKGIGLLEEYITNEFRQPTNLKDWIYLSQFTQANALKTAIVAHRNSNGRCSGSMPWQLNDASAVISWSLIDLNNIPKPAWYSLKTFFRNEILSADLYENSVRIKYNYQGKRRADRAVLTFQHREGLVIKSDTIVINPSNPEKNNLLKEYSKNFFSTPLSMDEVFLRMELYSGNRMLFRDLFFFVAENKFAWKPANISVELKKVSNDVTTARVSARTLVRKFFHGQHFNSTPNLIDILPNDTLSFSITLPDVEAWKSGIVCLNDFMFQKN